MPVNLHYNGHKMKLRLDIQHPCTWYDNLVQGIEHDPLSVLEHLSTPEYFRILNRRLHPYGAYYDHSCSCIKFDREENVTAFLLRFS
jgi:hypothetical protein